MTRIRFEAASEMQGLATWLISILDTELAAYAAQDAEAAERCHVEFDSGMERLRALAESEPEAFRTSVVALRSLHEAIEAHETHLQELRTDYGEQLRSVRAHAQIASYAPVPLDGVPSPRYYDQAG